MCAGLDDCASGGSGSAFAGTEVAAAGPEGDGDKGDERGGFDERADDAGEGGALCHEAVNGPLALASPIDSTRLTHRGK